MVHRNATLERVAFLFGEWLFYGEWVGEWRPAVLLDSLPVRLVLVDPTIIFEAREVCGGIVVKKVLGDGVHLKDRGGL